MIMMFSIDWRLSYKKMCGFYLSAVKPNLPLHTIPMVLCCNKFDLLTKEEEDKEDYDATPSKNSNHSSTPRKCLSPDQIKMHIKYNLPYVELSVKEEINMLEPFRYLLQALFQDSSIQIITSEDNDIVPLPPTPPSTIPMDEED
jgi:GTPase SAR1 family protein